MEIKGYLKRIIYRNPTNFYSVCLFSNENNMERTVTVVGILPDLQEHQLYEMTGEIVKDQKYGSQFKVESYKVVQPNEESGVVRFLSSPLFQGIGTATAQRIFDALGPDCLDMIKANPLIAATVKGVSEEKSKMIHSKLVEKNDMLVAMEFFTEHGLGLKNIQKITQMYGEKTIEKIMANPYKLIEDIDTIGFAEADSIAKRIKFERESIERYEACLIYSINKLCFESGDTQVIKEQLQKYTRENCDCTDHVLLDRALIGLVTNGRLIVKDDGMIVESNMNEWECKIADIIKSDYIKKDMKIKHIQSVLEATIRESDVNLTELQIEAIKCFLENKLTILTGGPGTGKTTATKSIIESYKIAYGNNSNFAICAPTGRAARRLTELCGHKAKTIHSILKWDLHSQSFGHDNQNPIEYNMLVIDEFSMVDTMLFASLLDASSNVDKILIVGDHNQLPSVGPGSVLKDLIESGIVPTIKLDKIHRQAQDSGIINLAYHVNAGLHNFDFSTFTDIRWFDIKRQDATEKIVSYVKSALTKWTIDEVQVLAPIYNGDAGIDEINFEMQKNYLDITQPHIQSGVYKYFVGDKILQLKNRHEDGIVNGDIGYVKKLIFKDEENTEELLRVQFDEVSVDFTKADIYYPEITHGYCMSVHKSQGSEYDVVILPIYNHYGQILDRQLLYTAITRAKKYLILLGDKSAFEKAVARANVHSRNTGLLKKLNEK